MKIHIERSITINCPPQKIYDVVSDLNQWNVWSPWMHSEPTAKTVYNGRAHQQGQYQTWDGEVIGSGKMTITKLEKNNSIGMFLEFFKPFKSIADVHFKIKTEAQDHSTVTWIMDTNLPFFMFFFKKMMMAYMGSDFERGLKMLKEYVETGKVASKSVYQGSKPISAFSVVGVRTKCQISELSVKMQKDFDLLNKYKLSGELPKPSGAASIYHVFDIANGVCEYTSGLTYEDLATFNVPKGLSAESYPEHQALVVDHFGAYRHLGNPWGMVVSYQRGKKKKLVKKLPMYEVYMTMPDQQSEEQIHTQVRAPIKI